MDVSAVSVDDAGAETTTNVLPNEILLNIFRFLQEYDLLRAEEVCSRWKTVVKMRFAIEKQLRMRLTTEKYPRVKMGRYGHSIQTFELYGHNTGECKENEMNWTKEIADRFPELTTMYLSGIAISNDDFRYLASKCCQLKNVTFYHCILTVEGLRLFLQALPGIKSFTIYSNEERTGTTVVTPCCASAVFSSCRSLETLKISGDYGSKDLTNFSRFCEECVTLRKLDIELSDMGNPMFAQIGNCSLLEELRIYDCQHVDGPALMQISHGCHNLRLVSLLRLPHTSDEGLKSFARCSNLSVFETDHEKVTDETVVELSKCVNLRKVRLSYCPLVSDRGCAALLAHCPQLEVLCVQHSNLIGNSTVASAIQAVQCRQNGLVLKLAVNGTKVKEESNKVCHPLLHLTLDYFYNING